MKRAWEAIAAAVHLLHGTRGLSIGAAGLLLLGLLDPLLPTALPRAIVVFPVFTVLAIGAATLPREAVAIQQRTRRLLGAEDRHARLLRALFWPALLVVLLAPRLFLAAYGVPHLSPFTGVLHPSVQQRIAVIYLFCTLLVAVLAVRATRRYATHIIPKRPKDLSRLDRSHQERDGLLWMGAGIVLAYGFVLQGFWHPFSLLQWPPDLGSFTRVRGVASIAFSISLPLLMFAAATGYGAMLREMRSHRIGADIVWLVVLHIALLLAAVVLHMYDLLWIADYREGARF